MDKYTPQSALKKILRNSEAKEIKTKEGFNTDMFDVKIGTFGIGTKGAIDYLNNYTRYRIYLVHRF